MQIAARDALREGLLRYHGGRGWTGPIATIDVGKGDLKSQLASSPSGISYKDWRVGVVTAAAGNRRGSALPTGRSAAGPACPTRSRSAMT
jgi:penicillin-binding protein 1A